MEPENGQATRPRVVLTGRGTGPADDGAAGEADGPRTPADAEADKHAWRVAAHADQERLVRRFIDVSHERLAGRDPSSRHLLGRQPRERVVLGVLAPRNPPTTAPPVSVGDLPAESGVPVDRIPDSEFGLTCLVEPDADVLTVDAAVTFALYLQHYPTYEEQLRHAALSADQDDATADYTNSARTEQAGAEPGDGDAGALGQQTSDLPEAQAVPVNAKVANAALSATVAADHAEDKPGKGATSDAIQLVYQRYDVKAAIHLTIPLPASSIPITVDDDGALRSVIADSIESQASAGIPLGRSGPAGGKYRLLASSSQRVPREAMADPDTFDRWLSASAQPGWTSPTAEPEFTATAHRDPSGRVRLALTLANTAIRAPRDHGFFPEVSVYDAGFEATVAGGSL